MRVAAGKTAQALSRVSIKMTDPEAGAKSSEAAVKAILPPLLDKGMTSSVSEVRSISLETMMKVTKSAGSLLAPHLHTLIPSLLEATGEIEGAQINYISTRLGVDKDVQEKLDSARMAASKSSPTMECVNFVLQYVNTEVLTQLVPRLVDIIKSNPSIVTRSGATHVITSLTHQCPLDLQQFTGKLLSALLSGLMDRNSAVRINFAGCIGHLMRTAKDSSREKLFMKLKTWYMEKENDASRAAVAYTFQAVSRHNPDVMKAFASFAMPIAFLAMHEDKSEENEEILSVWEEIWQEGTPGSEGGVRLFQTEIMELLPVGLSSSQWTVKAQSAKALGTVATKLGSSIDHKTQLMILELLFTALEGRTWTGKEAILIAVKNVAKAAPEILKDNMKEHVEKMLSVLFRECKKEKIEYKIVALETIGEVLNKVEVDKFSEIYEIVSDHLPKLGDEEEQNGDKDKEDDDEDKERSGKKLDLQHGVLNCVGLAWPKNEATTCNHLENILGHIEKIAKNTTRKNQLAVVKCVSNILKNLILPANIEFLVRVFSQLATVISVLLSIPKYNQLRTETLEILHQSVQLLEQVKSEDVSTLFRSDVSDSLDGVIKDLGSDPKTKTTARDLKQSLEKLTEK